MQQFFSSFRLKCNEMKRNGEILHPINLFKYRFSHDVFFQRGFIRQGECFRFAQVSTSLRFARNDVYFKNRSVASMNPLGSST